MAAAHELVVWRFQTKDLQQCLICSPAGDGHPIVGLCALPNPEYLASCTSAGLLRAWHLASNDTVAQLSIQQELTSMAIRLASVMMTC